MPAIVPKRSTVIALALAIALASSLSACSSSSSNPNSTPSSTPNIAIDPAARALVPKTILQAGVLNVAVDATYPPNEFTSAAGREIGWEVELVNAIGAKLGLTVKYRQVAFASIMPRIVSKTSDLGVASIFDTAERRKIVDLVDYYSAGILWAQLATAPRLLPDNACGKTVAVQKDTYQAMVDLPGRSNLCVKQGRSPITVVSYSNQSDASDAVELGRVDAFVADSPVTLYAVKQSAKKMVAVGETYGVLNYSFATEKGSSLAGAIKVAVQSLIDDGNYRKILASWGVQSGAVAHAKINGAG